MRNKFTHTSLEDRSSLYERLTRIVIDRFSTTINGVVSVLAILNFGQCFISGNKGSVPVIIAAEFMLYAMLVLWAWKGRHFLENIIEDAIVRRNYYKYIGNNLVGVDWQVMEQGNQCCGLSRDEQLFFVYYCIKPDFRYRLIVYKKTDYSPLGENYYEMQVAIRLSSLVPAELYNKEIFESIKDSNVYIFENQLPLDEIAYNNYIESTIRKRTIDDILADLS